MSIVAPTGLGIADYWKATVAGENGIGPISAFDASAYPSRLAGEVPGFDPKSHLPGRLIPQTDRLTQLALVAADWALADAEVEPSELSEFDMGVVTASASGGFEFGQRELEKLWSKGPEHVSAYQSFAWFYAVNSGQISIRNGMRGPGGVLVTEQAGGLDAAAQARRHVRNGVGLVLTGGVDASLCPWGWVAQSTREDLSTCESPDAAYLPFDENACGYVPGEGGAILVLEDADTAAERGLNRSYGTIAGYAATFDPKPGSGREPGLRRCVEQALADAGIAADEVDVVFADGAGTPEADRQEAEAIAAAFRTRATPVPVTAPKSATGRLYSGGSAVDLATALLALRDGVIPPTVNVRRPAPEYGMDLVVGDAREAELDTAVVLARGHGGFNSAMVVRRAD
ncbi:ketosynthase chain-length factor [Streptomonospora sp. PA3]|uniref:ketosynthase chain-length factor n=1 Tax=Streptomonospora sp. PA3 TaxID=2607326 RepID=UPI0037438D66